MIEIPATESSALVTKSANLKMAEPNQQPSGENNHSDMSKTINKDSLSCTHCKKSKHTRDTCWKLHERPQQQQSNINWFVKGSSSKGQAHVTQTRLDDEENSQETFAFKQGGEIGKLKRFLGTLEKHEVTGDCSLALSGKTLSHALYSSGNALLGHLGSWIIDSGAIDHMTHCSKKFISYTPSLSNRKIIIANGTLIINRSWPRWY